MSSNVGSAHVDRETGTRCCCCGCTSTAAVTAPEDTKGGKKCQETKSNRGRLASNTTNKGLPDSQPTTVGRRIFSFLMPHKESHQKFSSFTYLLLLLCFAGELSDRPSNHRQAGSPSTTTFFTFPPKPTGTMYNCTSRDFRRIVSANEIHKNNTGTDQQAIGTVCSSNDIGGAVELDALSSTDRQAKYR